MSKHINKPSPRELLVNVLRAEPVLANKVPNKDSNIPVNPKHPLSVQQRIMRYFLPFVANERRQRSNNMRAAFGETLDRWDPPNQVVRLRRASPLLKEAEEWNDRSLLEIAVGLQKQIEEMKGEEQEDGWYLYRVKEGPILSVAIHPDSGNFTLNLTDGTNRTYDPDGVRLEDETQSETSADDATDAGVQTEQQEKESKADESFTEAVKGGLKDNPASKAGSRTNYTNKEAASRQKELAAFLEGLFNDWGLPIEGRNDTDNRNLINSLADRYRGLVESYKQSKDDVDGRKIYQKEIKKIQDFILNNLTMSVMPYIRLRDKRTLDSIELTKFLDGEYKEQGDLGAKDASDSMKAITKILRSVLKEVDENEITRTDLIRNTLGDLIFSEEDETFGDVDKNLLKIKSYNISQIIDDPSDTKAKTSFGKFKNILNGLLIWMPNDLTYMLGKKVEDLKDRTVATKDPEMIKILNDWIPVVTDYYDNLKTRLGLSIDQDIDWKGRWDESIVPELKGLVKDEELNSINKEIIDALGEDRIGELKEILEDLVRGDATTQQEAQAGGYMDELANFINYHKKHLPAEHPIHQFFKDNEDLASRTVKYGRVLGFIQERYYPGNRQIMAAYDAKEEKLRMDDPSLADKMSRGRDIMNLVKKMRARGEDNLDYILRIQGELYPEIGKDFSAALQPEKGKLDQIMSEHEVIPGEKAGSARYFKVGAAGKDSGLEELKNQVRESMREINNYFLPDDIDVDDPKMYEAINEDAFFRGLQGEKKEKIEKRLNDFLKNNQEKFQEHKGQMKEAAEKLQINESEANQEYLLERDWSPKDLFKKEKRTLSGDYKNMQSVMDLYVAKPDAIPEGFNLFGKNLTSATTKKLENDYKKSIEDQGKLAKAELADAQIRMRDMVLTPDQAQAWRDNPQAAEDFMKNFYAVMASLERAKILGGEESEEFLRADNLLARSMEPTARNLENTCADFGIDLGPLQELRDEFQERFGTPEALREITRREDEKQEEENQQELKELLEQRRDEIMSQKRDFDDNEFFVYNPGERGGEPSLDVYRFERNEDGNIQVVQQSDEEIERDKKDFDINIPYLAKKFDLNKGQVKAVKSWVEAMRRGQDPDDKRQRYYGFKAQELHKFVRTLLPANILQNMANEAIHGGSRYDRRMKVAKQVLDGSKNQFTDIERKGMAFMPRVGAEGNVFALKQTDLEKIADKTNKEKSGYWDAERKLAVLGSRLVPELDDSGRQDLRLGVNPNILQDIIGNQDVATLKQSAEASKKVKQKKSDGNYFTGADIEAAHKPPEIKAPPKTNPVRNIFGKLGGIIGKEEYAMEVLDGLE